MCTRVFNEETASWVTIDCLRCDCATSGRNGQHTPGSVDKDGVVWCAVCGKPA